jgi:hypothetical protein
MNPQYFYPQSSPSPISIAVLCCRWFSSSPISAQWIFISSRNTFTNPNLLYRDFISFVSS